MEILSSFSTGCNWLRVLSTFTFVLTASQGVHARETYVQFATRLLEQPKAGAAIDSDLENLILRASNSYRASLQLPALKRAKPVFSFAARAHAMDLLRSSAMGHKSSNGHDFEARMRAVNPGQMVLPALAENAARLRNSKLTAAQKANALVKQWIASPAHRKNLINRSYVTIGLGVATMGDDTYAVQIFSGPDVKTNFGNIFQ
jgi:uncharacterized protein YkwD